MCSLRGVDECSYDNGGCGAAEFINCKVNLWTTYRFEEGNLTKIRVPLNWTTTELQDGTIEANVTEWELADITYEGNQTKIDHMVARGECQRLVEWGRGGGGWEPRWGAEAPRLFPVLNAVELGALPAPPASYLMCPRLLDLSGGFLSDRWGNLRRVG